MAYQIKNIQIDEQLHRDIKIEAARRGITIKGWVERTCREALLARTLVDTKAPYETEVPCTP